MKMKEKQLSYVLPITFADFEQMLLRLSRQSNMRVKLAEGDWILKKVADEGTQSPVIARLMMGILRLRDTAIPERPERDAFDTAYHFTMTSLFAARDAARALAGVWRTHSAKVESGEVAHLQGRSIRVEEDVDRELGQQADAFLNAATRGLKKGMQDTASLLGVNLGFLFQKQAAFDAGIAALKTSDSALAAYLREAREWSERLVKARNAVEHDGWTLPHVVYSRTNGGVAATEPVIDGQAASAFAALILDRLSCFVEEVTAHCLQRRMPEGIAVTEIPLPKRPTEAPERFRITPGVGGMPPWTIAYHAMPFEET